MAVGHRCFSATASPQKTDILSELLLHFDCVGRRPITFCCIRYLVRNAGIEDGLLTASIRESPCGHDHRVRRNSPDLGILDNQHC
jgi:hypothetical protein